MRIRFLNLLLVGSIVSSVMLMSCNKDEESTPDNPDYTQDKGEFKDPRDGKVYKWVKIGQQVWMAENLAFKVDTGGCVAYENNENYVSTYGYLYNWWTAKAVAPAGWHLPTNDEWTQLENYLIVNGYSYDGVVVNKGIAKSLATDNGWIFSGKSGAVGNSDFPEYRNKTGFSALPSGFRSYYDSFGLLGMNSGWWSATEYSSAAYIRALDYDNTEVRSGNAIKWSGRSVRCLKN